MTFDGSLRQTAFGEGTACSTTRGSLVNSNTASHTNRQRVLGLLTLMRLVPPDTEARTNASRPRPVCTAVVAKKQVVLPLLEAMKMITGLESYGVTSTMCRLMPDIRR